MADAPGHQQAHPRGGPLRRGRRRLLPGLEAGQAVLPHRPAHRDRRGRPGHHPARRRLCRDRSALPPQRDRHRLGGRVRTQGAHALPVVRPEHDGGAPAQGGVVEGRGARHAGPDPALARSRGDGGGGPREPGRPPHGRGHRARLAPRGHVPGVVRALRPRICGHRPGSGRAGLRRHRVPPPRRARGLGLGPRLGRAAPRTSCGRTSKRPWPSTASRTAAGPRATTAGPAPGSGSSTWWRRPSRPAGGSQGTGQDLASGGTVPVRFLETAGALERRRCATREGVR